MNQVTQVPPHGPTGPTPITPQNAQALLDDLYKQKGELLTQFEIIQNKMQGINQQIMNLINIIPPK